MNSESGHGLSASVSCLRGVGSKLAEKLASLGIHQVRDALLQQPLRYEDRSRIYPLTDLVPGDAVQFSGVVENTKLSFGRKKTFRVLLRDGDEEISLLFFNLYPNQMRQLTRGTRLLCFGEIRAGMQGMNECIHPQYKVISKVPKTKASDHWTPVYRQAEGLGQERLQQIVAGALAVLEKEKDIDLPGISELEKLGLPTYREAMLQLHRPPLSQNRDQLEHFSEKARRRLAAEELLAHTLSLRVLRQKRQVLKAIPVRSPANVLQDFVSGLPFTLTAAQQRVIAEILDDMAGHEPMLRLVQGDVGSGKTVVAAAAAIAVAANSGQTAILAPTEVLAEQHMNTFRRWFEPLGIQPVWLTARVKGKEREAALHRIASGAAVIIGTHALIQESVQFKSLQLAVIDEQHRFGVHQRMALQEKGAGDEGSLHQLVMTATPIPRSLAMTVYADLDLSVIDELPPGRQTIDTRAISNARREQVVERIAHACRDGEQVYWVCTLVEESEKLDAEAATATREWLQEMLPDMAVGLIHGRMKGQEKDEVMHAFKAGEIQLLVATTVIEVGVDVPNASLMIIDNAERLGLAQLHQLRGRVGRGSRKSHCLLMYQPPLSETARSRLEIMRESNDGFVIARRDLEIRGPGEILGVRQKGELGLKMYRFERDADFNEQARSWADRLLENEPETASKLLEDWFAHTQHYANV